MKMKKFRHNHISTNLMYVPAILLFFLFVIYPMITGIKISFTNWNGFSQSYKYVGFENYIAMFKDKNVWSSFSNTIIYGVGSTVFQQIAGLSTALLINSKFKGRTIGRTIIYMPVLIAAVIMGNMWYFLLQYDGGALNDILILIGKEPVDWLTQGNLTVWIIVLVNTLQFYGISMVIYLAGLQGIPQMYYEAADIDGAKKLSKFFNITVPLLMPAISTSVVLNLIGGLKLFDVVKALTNGGPGYSTHSLSTLVNFTYFNNQSAGYASVIGLLLFTFIIIVSLVAQKFFKSREVDL
ncbi:MAG: sugar ABC transporter permease [Clostridiales bacterium]|nr:sugar ABC transporter permease [Clostridiales bacterium]